MPVHDLPPKPGAVVSAVVSTTDENSEYLVSKMTAEFYGYTDRAHLNTASIDLVNGIVDTVNKWRAEASGK